jgi:hypothetical protein
MKQLEIGDPVIYIDQQRVEHNALVTQVFSETCCNVLFVSLDSAKCDPYGRQVERWCSVVHVSMNSARANCFRRTDEQA